MGTRQTLDVLEAYALMMSEGGDAVGAEAVRALGTALEVAGNSTLKATATKIRKAWEKTGEPGISAVHLAPRLRSLEALLAAGGARAVAADLKVLIDLTVDRRAVPANEFEARLREAILFRQPNSAPKKSAKQPKREPLTAGEIRQWADRLTATTTDQAAFEAELSAILDIPKVSLLELKSIAEQYLGYEPPRSKKDIIKKLKTRQMQDAMEAGRQSRIQRIAV